MRKFSEAPGSFNESENPDDQLLAELLDKYLSSLDSEAPISLAALQEQYPHLSDQLAHFGEDVEAIHRATKKLSSDGLGALPRSFGIPKQIGDFAIGREIGRGGMGIVYEAYQASLDRNVAIKILPSAAVWDHKQVTRFQNEARAAAQTSPSTYCAGIFSGRGGGNSLLCHAAHFRSVARQSDSSCQSKISRAPQLAMQSRFLKEISTQY